MPPHDDCHMIDEMRAQSKRHHDALTRITEVTSAIQAAQNTILGHLVGTFDKPGLAHQLASVAGRVDKIEAGNRLSFWRDLGMTAARAIVVAIVVGGLLGTLLRGYRETIREIIMDTPRAVSMAKRYAPKDPTCLGCAPTVAAAE